MAKTYIPELIRYLSHDDFPSLYPSSILRVFRPKHIFPYFYIFAERLPVVPQSSIRSSASLKGVARAGWPPSLPVATSSLQITFFTIRHHSQACWRGSTSSTFALASFCSFLFLFFISVVSYYLQYCACSLKLWRYSPIYMNPSNAA